MGRMVIGFFDDRCFFNFRSKAVSFEPFDTVDKASMPLMHHKFNRIKILPAIEASCQIVFGIDGGVCAMANGAVEAQLIVFVASGN